MDLDITLYFTYFEPRIFFSGFFPCAFIHSSFFQSSWPFTLFNFHSFSSLLYIFLLNFKPLLLESIFGFNESRLVVSVFLADFCWSWVSISCMVVHELSEDVDDLGDLLLLNFCKLILLLGDLEKKTRLLYSC